jgi:BTB/POZ domain
MLTSEEEPANLLFEYPGADIILRSNDSHHFRVPKSYIVHSSPVLEKLIQRAPGPPDGAHKTSLPVVQLPESGTILHNLLTFIFPVSPVLPSTTEKSMELLSLAQKYQLSSVMDYIRYHISRQSPSSTERDSALHLYHLAQKYGLRHEALQAAQTLSRHPMNICDLKDKLDMMPGASLYELWRYHEKVRAILKADLMGFRTSGARGTVTSLRCKRGSSQIPDWLDNYIESIGDAPNRFDLIEFNTALARHIRGGSQPGISQNDACPGCRCQCGGRQYEGSHHSNCTCGTKSMSSQTIRKFWEALTSVVHGSFKKVVIIDVSLLRG